MINKIKDFYTGSIKKQLIIGIALVHTVMMSFFVYDLIEKERDFLIEQHAKKAISLSKTLASTSTSWVLANDVIGVQEIVSSMQNYPGVKYIMITNTQGQILAHSNKKFIGKYITDNKSISFLKGKVQTNNIFENKYFIDVVSPILRDNQHIGWARIALNKNEINEGLYHVTISGIIYTLLAIFIGIIFAYFMGKGLTHSIYQILETIKKIKSGDYTTYSNLIRNDEIGILSKEFDNMIKKLKASKDELKKVNERHELTLDGLKDGIWDWDITTNKTHFSKNWKSMLGYEIDEIEDNADAFFNLVYEEDKSKIKDALDIHFQDPKNNIYSLEIRLRCKDGSYKWILSRGSVLLDKENKPYRMLGFHTDISKEKENEINIKKQQIIIEEQSKHAAMGEMIGNIAHQWRQPLSVISTVATGMMLQRQMKELSNEEFENSCNVINDNAQYLSKTIDDFKNFIKNNRNFEKFYLSNIISSFFSLTEASIKRYNIEMIFDLNDNIEMEGYPNELIQCFMNIFNNSKDALKNTSQNHRYIFIKTYIENNNIVINFRDNAGGVSTDALPRIFEPYFTTKHQTQGTGLGLSMVYKLITEGMDGQIIANNITYEHNNHTYDGAEFTITLPLT